MKPNQKHVFRNGGSRSTMSCAAPCRAVTLRLQPTTQGRSVRPVARTAHLACVRSRPAVPRRGPTTSPLVVRRRAATVAAATTTEAADVSKAATTSTTRKGTVVLTREKGKNDKLVRRGGWAAAYAAAGCAIAQLTRLIRSCTSPRSPCSQPTYQLLTVCREAPRTPGSLSAGFHPAVRSTPPPHRSHPSVRNLGRTACIPSRSLPVSNRSYLTHRCRPAPGDRAHGARARVRGAAADRACGGGGHGASARGAGFAQVGLGHRHVSRGSSRAVGRCV
jgi:hypothetical protein